jgi:uncharacterized protein YdhG (YjbR/CyaY superfamily)
MSAAGRHQTLEAYLGSVDSIKAQTLRSIIRTILSTSDKLEGVIAWNVPQIRLGRHYVFGLSASKNHLTLAPWSPPVIEAFRPRLSPFVVRKNCFLVPVDWQPDVPLLIDLVKARLTELGESPVPRPRRKSPR